MKKSIKDSLNGLAKMVSSFLGDFGKTIASILRIIVLSSCRTAFHSRQYKELKQTRDCCVLGNGPSLTVDFDSGRVHTEGVDLFCVNMFCSSSLFWELKPRFYYLIDGGFFAPVDDRQRKQIEELQSVFSEVDWDMYLVISSSTISGSVLLENLNNTHIHVICMNSTNVDGFRSFRHWVYRHRLGMPRCQTVVNFAICAAINFGYTNVYLYGADHTWTRDLFVDDNNTVCYGDRHVYNSSLTVIRKKENFAELLDEFSLMFKSHYLLEDYSKVKGTKIWNCGSDTFLDAYERL